MTFDTTRTPQMNYIAVPAYTCTHCGQHSRNAKLCKEFVCAVRPAPKRAPRATHPAQSRSKCHQYCLVVFCLCNQAFLSPFIGLGFVVVLCFLFAPLSFSLFISLCLHHPSPKQLNHLLGPRRMRIGFLTAHIRIQLDCKGDGPVAVVLRDHFTPAPVMVFPGYFLATPQRQYTPGQIT